MVGPHGPDISARELKPKRAAQAAPCQLIALLVRPCRVYVHAARRNVQKTNRHDESAHTPCSPHPCNSSAQAETHVTSLLPLLLPDARLSSRFEGDRQSTHGGQTQDGQQADLNRAESERRNQTIV